MGHLMKENLQKACDPGLIRREPTTGNKIKQVEDHQTESWTSGGHGLFTVGPHSLEAEISSVHQLNTYNQVGVVEVSAFADVQIELRAPSREGAALVVIVTIIHRIIQSPHTSLDS